VSKWISIDEGKKPPFEVLVTDGDRYSVAAFDMKTHKWNGPNNSIPSAYITHWCYLPNLPEEDEE
jgi:hypothetical protein